MSELFSARLKKLSGDELKNAFGERAKVKCTEDFFHEKQVKLELNSEFSPYNNLRVKCHNPEVRCNDDGSVTDASIREADIFSGGFLAPWFTSIFGETFSRVSTKFIIGHFDKEDSYFAVYDNGINPVPGVNDILLRFQANDGQLTQKFLDGLQKSAKYFAKAISKDEEYYITVMSMYQKITTFGNVARQKVRISHQDMARLDRDLFPRQFQHRRIDNGVLFCAGWMIDRQGNEIQPNFQEVLQERARKTLTEEIIETWTAPQNGDICLSCWMSDDGEVSLKYGRPYYPCRGHADTTKHQLRRMEILRRAIIEKLGTNAEQWSTPDEIYYSSIHWEDQDTDYGQR